MNESDKNIKEDLAVWFGKKKKPKGSKQPKGPWVNICRKDKDGKHPPCGRTDSDGDGKKDGAYPKCRAAGVAGKMSDAQKKSACAQKRRAEKKNPKTGKGNKPTMVSHKNESYSILTNEAFEETRALRPVKPSTKVVKNVCDAKKFCEDQGPITFGQLKYIVKAAKGNRLALHIGEGGFKAFIRLLPWFLPQVAIGGFIASGMRAANKFLSPTLTETPSYKSWWAKVILKIFKLAEGDINPTDPFSKIFFISDGLMTMMNEESKIKFAFYISELAEKMDDSQIVPEYFVENELRNWINQKYLLDPPLEPKIIKDKDSEESTEEIKENKTMNTKIIKLNERDLYSIVDNVIKEQNHRLSKYDTVTDIAVWSDVVSKNSKDDFKYFDSERYRIAVDNDNEYLAHWDHKLGKGFFDEMDLVPADHLKSLGVVVDDKEYDYVDGLTESELIEGKKEGKKKKSNTQLCARGKSAAKAKFDVYPSAFANGFAVQVCQGRMPGLDGNKKCSGKFCKGKK